MEVAKTNDSCQIVLPLYFFNANPGEVVCYCLFVSAALVNQNASEQQYPKMILNYFRESSSRMLVASALSPTGSALARLDEISSGLARMVASVSKKRLIPDSLGPKPGHLGPL